VLNVMLNCNLWRTSPPCHSPSVRIVVIVVSGMQLLRLHCTIRRQHPPQRAVQFWVLLERVVIIFVDEVCHSVVILCTNVIVKFCKFKMCYTDICELLLHIAVIDVVTVCKDAVCNLSQFRGYCYHYYYCFNCNGDYSNCYCSGHPVCRWLGILIAFMLYSGRLGMYGSTWALSRH